LACDDRNENPVFSFDKETYEFTWLSQTEGNFGGNSKLSAEDCCAVGVQVDGDERIYILGGRNGGNPDGRRTVDSVRYYSVTNHEWHLVADMHVGRSHLGCALAKVDDHQVIYAIGGGNSDDQLTHDSIEVYDIESDTWTITEDFLDPPRTRLGVLNVDDKYLMLIGGDAHCVGCAGDLGSNAPLTDVNLIDITDNNKVYGVLGADGVPQLQISRQTPSTVLREKRSGDQDPHKEVYVIAGATTCDDTSDGSACRRNTMGVRNDVEILCFDRINT
jgi:hypothetical protein